ncbi:hypothetical protein [Rhodococcus opacus]|nr:hypothetical protein Pd630_LPD16182 [Rhodococcus opacus PD630]
MDVAAASSDVGNDRFVALAPRDAADEIWTNPLARLQPAHNLPPKT